MAREGLVGSRIRERRAMAGLKQADLARRIGISASYLNLIEHNRRRIGGKLLLDIAAVLEVEPSALSEGAEAALIATLQETAADLRLPVAEAERGEDFAGRFPGWAGALATSRRRIAELERTVETLTDRLTHDPQLAASVHELLSTAAAIRSTASLLAGSDDMDPIWRNRFHANIDEDSRRLADTSTALVGFLEAEKNGGDLAGSPQEEVDRFLAAARYFFPEFEPDAGNDLDAAIARIISQAETLGSRAARHMARDVLEQAARDAAALPMSRLEAALKTIGPDPAPLSRHLGVRVSVVLRRLACVASLDAGLIVADRAGSLLLRKPASGFAIPRFGNCCPLWPLFEVNMRPGMILRRDLRQLGHSEALFRTYALTQSQNSSDYNQSPLSNSLMLVIPLNGAQAEGDVHVVGSHCRVCPRPQCPGRREPSILTGGY